MKFKIESIANNSVETMMKEYPCLFDFDLEIINTPWYGETIKNAYVNIDTIEELADLIRSVDEKIVVGKDNNGDYYIEIYDDFRE